MTMGYDVHVLCRPQTAAGFALAGLASIEAATPQEGAARLVELASRPGAGVILVEEGFYDALAEDIRRALGRRPLPMVVPFPAPLWTDAAAAADAYIVEILRQAIGYSVRLR